MKTNKFVRFVKKLHLGGLINEALWRKHGDTLGASVSKGSLNKPRLFASVKMMDVFGVENGDIGVDCLKEFYAYIRDIHAESLSLSLVKHPSGEVAALRISNNETSVQLDSCCLDEFQTVVMPELDGEWNAGIVFDKEIKNAFIKSLSAFGNYPFCLFTVVASKRTGKLSIVFGYREKSLSDNICLGVTCADGLNEISRPLAFEALTLKRILLANSEFKNPILYVSEDGHASIQFFDNEIEARYVLKEIEVEE